MEFEVTSKVTLIVNTTVTANNLLEAVAAAIKQHEKRTNILPLAKSVNISDEEIELISVSTGHWL